MRPAASTTPGELVRVPTSAAISSACWWCGIIMWVNIMSARLCGAACADADVAAEVEADAGVDDRTGRHGEHLAEGRL